MPSLQEIVQSPDFEKMDNLTKQALIDNIAEAEKQDQIIEELLAFYNRQASRDEAPIEVSHKVLGSTDYEAPKVVQASNNNDNSHNQFEISRLTRELAEIDQKISILYQDIQAIYDAQAIDDENTLNTQIQLIQAASLGNTPAGQNPAMTMPPANQQPAPAVQAGARVSNQPPKLTTPFKIEPENNKLSNLAPKFDGEVVYNRASPSPRPSSKKKAEFEEEIRRSFTSETQRTRERNNQLNNKTSEIRILGNRRHGVTSQLQNHGSHVQNTNPLDEILLKLVQSSLQRIRQREAQLETFLNILVSGQFAQNDQERSVSNFGMGSNN